MLFGEMISYHKLYSVFSKNIPRKFVRLLSKGLKVQAKEKLGTYLGCPRDVDGRNLNVFQGIHQKVNTTITSWKFNNLNQAGKLILINSILAVYTFHIMTTFLFPRKVLKSVTSSLLRFWRVSSKDRKPIYWEKISFLEEHKNCGGLSLRNLENLNKATLFKQYWCIHCNRDLLVSLVFREKYSEQWFQKSMEGKIPQRSSWGGRSIMKSVQ